MSGIGFRASMPSGWTVERPPRTVSASSPDGPEVVSVASFRLARPITPDLWDEAVQELNDAAARLAERLAPSAGVESIREGTLAGERARIYEIRYRREGSDLLERVVFVLVGRREFQLTCRIDVESPEAGEEACAELLRSFRVL